MNPGEPYRLAVLASHAVQYQAPLFRALAEHGDVDLDVFFFRSWGVDEYQDEGFGTSFSWDVPLLHGYRTHFPKNLSLVPGSTHFFGAVNPQVFLQFLANHFDAVLIQGWALASYWFGWLGALIWRVPVLLRCEANQLTEKVGPRNAIRRAVLRVFFRGVDAFLSIGTLNERFYRSLGIPDRKLFLAPYAVDNRRFRDRSQCWLGRRRELRKRYGVPLDRPVVLFCGKLTARKRPADLLAAARCCSLPVCVVFVGDGPLRREIEELVDQSEISDIRLLGFRNQSELPDCYALADVFVLPSVTDTWGLVLNEAMACGLPVVASEGVAAATDLVHEGVNGYTYPVGNVDMLADRLGAVLADQATTRAMGAASREIIARWSIDEAVKGIVNALRCVGRKSG